MTEEEARAVLRAVGEGVHGWWCESCLKNVTRDLQKSIPYIGWRNLWHEEAKKAEASS
jgi:hypothetical protein